VNDALPPVRTRTRLSTAGRSAVPVAAASLIASWLFGGVIGLFASAAVAALLLAVVLARLSLSGLRVAPPAPARAHVGDVFPLALELENAGSFRARHVGVRCGDERGRDGVRCARIAPGERVRVVATHRLLRRGRHRTLVVTLSSSFPFGLVDRRATFELPCELLALPRLGSLNELTRLPHVRRSDVQAPARLVRGDEEFYGVRAWREGMSMRRVHWKLSARRGRRIVREMRAEEDAPVRLTLVACVPEALPLDAPRRRFERAVSLTATLAEHFLRAGRTVRLAFADSASAMGPGSGSGPAVEAARGRAGLLRILTALAEVEPRLATLDEVERASAGAQPSRDELVLVVFVGDGATSLDERRGAGVFAIDVEHPDAERLYLGGRRWGMGAPLGLREQVDPRRVGRAPELIGAARAGGAS